MKFFKKAALEFDLSDDWRQLKYLAKHKAYILAPARQLGIPLSTALKHDWSKFTPAEWDPYTDFWFTPGGKQDPKAQRAFKKAWEHHKSKSPHHFDRKGSPLGSDIPVHRLERIADWYAASKANVENPKTFPSFKEWYLQRGPRQGVRPVTDRYIRMKLREL